MIGVDVEQEYSKQIKKGRPNKSGKNSGVSGESRKHTANQLGINEHYITDAKTIRQKNPEWAAKAGIGGMLPPSKGGRGKKSPVSATGVLDRNTLAAYRKLDEHKDKLKAYREATETLDGLCLRWHFERTKVHAWTSTARMALSHRQMRRICGVSLSSN